MLVCLSCVFGVGLNFLSAFGTSLFVVLEMLLTEFLPAVLAGAFIAIIAVMLCVWRDD